MKFLAKNFGTLAPLVVSSAAGMKSFSAIGKVTTKVVKANAAATLVLNKGLISNSAYTWYAIE